MKRFQLIFMRDCRITATGRLGKNPLKFLGCWSQLKEVDCQPFWISWWLSLKTNDSKFYVTVGLGAMCSTQGLLVLMLCLERVHFTLYSQLTCH